jgi:Tol biopolymer transport system component
MNPETREVTSQPGGALGVEPAWSPTADMIAFVRHDIGRLFLMRPDGSELREFFIPYINDVFEPSWSPDGRRIAFGCIGYGMGVCVINSDGTGFVRLTRTQDYAVAPAWSPDGKTIAFEIWRADMGEIALMAPDGSAVTRVADGYSPAWSRDGTMLVFSRKAGGLFISKADGSAVTRLTTGGDSPSWRP